MIRGRRGRKQEEKENEERRVGGKMRVVGERGE